MSGILYVVATPIGNLEDLTMRAARVLREVGLIAAEDTREVAKILNHLEIRGTRTVSLHEHSAPQKVQSLCDDLDAGIDIAFVSDAGTPGVNDPGGKLVAAAFARGIRVVPIPGVSAVTAAISVCGFPMDDFVYIGFMPLKKGRQKMMHAIGERDEATILFESTHRIMKTLEAMRAHLAPERVIFIGRELTKMHETLYRGSIDAVIEALQHTSVKGEFVLIVAPKKFV